MLAAKEVRRCWLTLGSGFESDLITQWAIAKRISKLHDQFGSFRRKSHRVDFTRETDFRTDLEIFFSAVFCPLMLEFKFSDHRINKLRKLGLRTHRHTLKGNEFDVNVRSAVIRVPDYTDAVNCLDMMPSWLSAVNIQQIEEDFAGFLGLCLQLLKMRNLRRVF